MRRNLLLILGIFILGPLICAEKSTKKIGGIGGQAIFDSVAKRPIIKSLEINNYLNANSLKPGDLILEIDKIPVHKMTYGEVLKLVQGAVGTPMSLKVLRYNGIEKYYEINRIRVTLDMQPTWWQVPDYSYYNFVEGINYTISQLKVNGRNSMDTSSKIVGSKDRVYCNFNIRGAYESIYQRTPKGRYSWDCSFVKTDDKSKADGMYNYLVIQLRSYAMKNAQLIKTESLWPEAKTYAIKTKEVSDMTLQNLSINVNLKKEFDKGEKRDLWKVEVQVSI
ncbi:MAG: hypothetical protein JWN78_736 [Bacteroidota bacterium]|nr:hypothetical protein [Bacteroidota bacterium]